MVLTVCHRLCRTGLFREMLCVADTLAFHSQDQLRLLKQRLVAGAAYGNAANGTAPGGGRNTQAAGAPSPLPSPLAVGAPRQAVGSRGTASTPSGGTTASHIASLGAKGSTGNKLLRLLQTVAQLAPHHNHHLDKRFDALWTQLEECVGLVAKREGLLDEEDQVEDNPLGDGDDAVSVDAPARTGSRRRRGGASAAASGSGSSSSGRPGRARPRLPRVRSGSIHGVFGADEDAAKPISASGSALLSRFIPLVRCFFLAHDSPADADVDAELLKRATAAAAPVVTPAKPSQGDDNDTDMATGAADPPASAPASGSGSNAAAAPQTPPPQHSAARHRMVSFVGKNHMVLNAMIRTSPSTCGARAVTATAGRVVVAPAHCSAVLCARPAAHGPRGVDQGACHPAVLGVRQQTFLVRGAAASSEGMAVRAAVACNACTNILGWKQSQRSGVCRINVRRDNVLSDSFRQLRMKSANEMRSKLVVTFSGEEGVDAGGLTREWYTYVRTIEKTPRRVRRGGSSLFPCCAVRYSILMRAILNFDNGLFINSEESLTVQPNPISAVVQPEHLEYFKFVGRVVGKALADGQLLDVHFTRSFYKHMLGIPITYHVRGGCFWVSGNGSCDVTRGRTRRTSRESTRRTTTP